MSSSFSSVTLTAWKIPGTLLRAGVFTLTWIDNPKGSTHVRLILQYLIYMVARSGAWSQPQKLKSIDSQIRIHNLHSCSIIGDAVKFSDPDLPASHLRGGREKEVNLWHGFPVIVQP